MKLSKVEFQKLRDEWYQKLRDSGFKDIEHKSYEKLEGQHKNPKNKVQVTDGSLADPLRFRADVKASYFVQIGHILDAGAKFKNYVDQYIFVRYIEGISLSEIALELKGMGKARHPRTVGRIIKRYEMRWKIRTN